METLEYSDPSRDLKLKIDHYKCQYFTAHEPVKSSSNPIPPSSHLNNNQLVVYPPAKSPSRRRSVRASIKVESEKVVLKNNFLPLKKKRKNRFVGVYTDYTPTNYLPPLYYDIATSEKIDNQNEYLFSSLFIFNTRITSSVTNDDKVLQFMRPSVFSLLSQAESLSSLSLLSIRNLTLDRRLTKSVATLLLQKQPTPFSLQLSLGSVGAINSLSSQFFPILKQSSLSSSYSALTALSFEYTTLGPNLSTSLFEAIQGHPNLSVLSLKAVSLSVSAASLPPLLLSLRSLTSLDLSCNDIGDKVAKRLLSSIHKTSISALYIDQTGVTLMRPIVRLIHAATHLTSLSIRHNEFGPTGAKILSSLFSAPPSSSHPPPSSLMSPFRHLDCGYCRFGIVGARYIAQRLSRWKGVHTLIMDGNYMTTKGVSLLLENLSKKCQLYTLLLSENSIAEECGDDADGENNVIESIINKLPSTISSLSIHDDFNPFSPALDELIEKKIQHNQEQTNGIIVSPKIVDIPIKFHTTSNCVQNFTITNTALAPIAYSLSLQSSINASISLSFFVSPQEGYLPPGKGCEIQIEVKGNVRKQEKGVKVEILYISLKENEWTVGKNCQFKSTVSPAQYWYNLFSSSVANPAIFQSIKRLFVPLVLIDTNIAEIEIQPTWLFPFPAPVDISKLIEKKREKERRREKELRTYDDVVEGKRDGLDTSRFNVNRRFSDSLSEPNHPQLVSPKLSIIPVITPRPQNSIPISPFSVQHIQLFSLSATPSPHGSQRRLEEDGWNQSSNLKDLATVLEKPAIIDNVKPKNIQLPNSKAEDQSSRRRSLPPTKSKEPLLKLNLQRIVSFNEEDAAKAFSLRAIPSKRDSKVSNDSSPMISDRNYQVSTNLLKANNQKPPEVDEEEIKQLSEQRNLSEKISKKKSAPALSLQIDDDFRLNNYIVTTKTSVEHNPIIMEKEEYKLRCIDEDKQETVDGEDDEVDVLDEYLSEMSDDTEEESDNDGDKVEKKRQSGLDIITPASLPQLKSDSNGSPTLISLLNPLSSLLSSPPPHSSLLKRLSYFSSLLSSQPNILSLLLSFETATLTEALIADILKHYPTAEEITILTTSNDPISITNWAPVEQLFFELATNKIMHGQLEMYANSWNFDFLIEIINDSIITHNTAYTQLITSKTWSLIIEKLKIEVIQYNIPDLITLFQDVDGKKKEILVRLVNFVQTNCPRNTDWYNEVKGIKLASTVSTIFIGKELNSLEKKINKISEYLSNKTENNTNFDKAIQNMYNKYIGKYNELKSQNSNLTSKVSDFTLNYSNNNYKFDYLCNLISKFIKDYNEIKKELIMQGKLNHGISSDNNSKMVGSEKIKLKSRTVVQTTL